MKERPPVLDLTRAQLAYDQRIVLATVLRGYVLIALFVILGGVLPPANEYWIVLGAFAATITGLALSAQFSYWPSVLYWAVGLILAVFFVLRLVEAALTGSPFAMFASPVELVDRFDAPISEAQAAYRGEQWAVIRLLAAAIGAIVALECLLGLFRALRLNRVERRLLMDRKASSLAALARAMADVPPGLIWYMRSAWGSAALAALAWLLFLFASTTIVLVPWNVNLQATRATIACVEAGRKTVPCVAGQGAANQAMFLTQIASSLGLALLGVALSMWSRRIGARSAARRLGNDRRKRLLFLRSFADDPVKLRSSNMTPMGFALTPRALRVDLDAMLLVEFGHLAPPHALGRAGDRTPPFGALREYVSMETEDGAPVWQRVVAEKAKDAACIVIVFDHEIVRLEKGTRWELDFLSRDPALKSKTVLLAHPRLRDAALNRQAWSVVAEVWGVELPQTGERLLGAWSPDSGRCNWLSAEEFSMTGYLLAMRAFLYDPSITSRIGALRA